MITKFPEQKFFVSARSLEMKNLKSKKMVVKMDPFFIISCVCACARRESLDGIATVAKGGWG